MDCPHYQQARCSSCSRIEQDYPAQLAVKQAHLQHLLANHSVGEWRSPIASAEQGFRNKAKMVVSGAAHAPVLGIVNPAGEAVSLTDCLLYPPGMQALLQRLQRWVQQAGLPPYHIRKAKGELKYILLTRSQYRDEYLLRFVLRSESSIARLRHALPLLLADYPNITVVSVNIQPVHMAVLEGEQEIILSKATRLEENWNGVPLWIRPKSFFQTNPTVAAHLYRAAREWSQELQPASIWDLFCGVGGFGLHCARRETELTGIEVEAEAIACARDSAAMLGLERVSFAALDSDGFAELQQTAPDLLIVNPPRRGLGMPLCTQINGLAPPAVFYSSCNPETLTRDLVQLPDYRIRRVQLFDMFPHTAHYEVLVWLERVQERMPLN